MKQKTKIISRISAIALALIITMTSLVTAFGATTASGGHRGSDTFGVKWRQEVPFSYTDANGNTVSSVFGTGLGIFPVHFLAQQGQTLTIYNFSQRAFCIEPEKWLEGPSDYDTARNYQYTGSYTYDTLVGNEAYDTRLTPVKKMLVNYVLANGYKNYVPADASHAAYWYATQLLIYETVMGWRNSNFDAPQHNLNPTTYLTTDTSAETSVADIQKAYDNIVGWVKLTLKNPAGTSASAETAPTYNMQYSEKLGKYYYDYEFNDLIRQDLTDNANYAVKLSAFNIKDSDIMVYGDNNISYTIDKVNKRIRFTTDEPFDGSISVAFCHNPRIRAINESLNTTAPNGLMIMPIPGTNNQAFASGSARLVDRPAYFKLKTVDAIKLKLNTVSSDADFVAGNSCYSLAGAVYGVYSDLTCQNLVGTMTTDENGEAVYNDGDAVPNKLYWVRELTPSKGYMADTEVHRFLDSGEMEDGVPVYTTTSTETPKNNSLYIALYSNGIPSVVNLDGAKIRVNFYGDLYSSAEELEGVKPLKTWFFEADEDGYMDYDAEHYVAGDKLYEVNGIPCVPIGTITIKEVEAPSIGWFEVNPNTYLVQTTDFNDIYIDLKFIEPPEPAYAIGDANKDGHIDTLDAILVEKYSVEKANMTEQQIYLADVNDDHSVDVLDSILIQKYAVEKIKEFPKKAA